MSTTEPSTDLAAEVARLRIELAELSEFVSLMTGEMRTHRLVIDDHEGNEHAVIDRDQILTRRLVVVDEAGAPRITTTCETNRTALCVTVEDPNDDLGVGNPTDVNVWIEAEFDRTGSRDDEGPSAFAQVMCSTGDDAFAILEQRSIVGERRPGVRTVTGRSEVRLFQHQDEASWSDSAMCTRSLSIVEVGADGVVERDVAHNLLAHSPMQRVVQRSAR